MGKTRRFSVNGIEPISRTVCYILLGIKVPKSPYDQNDYYMLSNVCPVWIPNESIIIGSSGPTSESSAAAS
jgi:hypothetical protein